MKNLILSVNMEAALEAMAVVALVEDDVRLGFSDGNVLF